MENGRGKNSFRKSTTILPVFAVICTLGTFLIFGLGCYQPPLVTSTSVFQSSFPTKDEVAVVSGRPLSIRDFLVIRSQMPTQTAETALWTGIAMLSLQTETKNKGREISLQSALHVARYAAHDLSPDNAQIGLKEYYAQSKDFPSPDEVKKEIESITQKLVIRRNPQPLSQFN